MKQIVSNYTYSPTANCVTLTGVNIDADQLLLIVAPEAGRTLYNFASVTGSVVPGASTRVNLTASTAGLTASSPLVIYYDDQASATSVTGTVALDPASLLALENVTVTIGSSVTVGGTVTANTYNGLNWIYVAGSFDYTNGEDTTGTLYLNTYFKRVSEYRWESFNYIAGEEKCTAYIIQEDDDGQGYWRLYVQYDGLAGAVGSANGILAENYLNTPEIYSKFPPKTGWIIRTDLGFTGSVSVNYIQPETYQSQITNSVTVGSLPVQLSTTTIGGTARLNVTLSSATTVGGTAPSYANLYGGSDGTNLRAILTDTAGRSVVTVSNFPASQTVTFGAITGAVTMGAISGTVTVNNPSGALTTRFGSVTTANLATLTAAVTNTSRKYLLAQNISAGTVTIGIGFSPTTTQGIQLTAGAGLSFDAFCPTGAVYWLGATTGANFTILEG